MGVRFLRFNAVSVLGIGVRLLASWAFLFLIAPLLAAFGCIPTVILGPGDLSLAHSPRESVPTAEIVEAATGIFLTGGDQTKILAHIGTDGIGEFGLVQFHIAPHHGKDE